MRGQSPSGKLALVTFDPSGASKCNVPSEEGNVNNETDTVLNLLPASLQVKKANILYTIHIHVNVMYTHILINTQYQIQHDCIQSLVHKHTHTHTLRINQ